MPQLNPRQREAVRYIDGPMLVLAGAGSGKTSVITQKIAYLVETCGIKASRVAAVTFTNKAAREMKERVSQLVSGPAARGLTVSTFHNLGLNILRKEYRSLGYKSGFSIFDSPICAWRKACRSLPQIPAAVTRSSTLPGGGGPGCGTRSTRISAGPCSRAASMVSGWGWSGMSPSFQ